MPEGRLRRLIVPIFIPNQGCPHRCVFCEQERITSQSIRNINREQVKRVLDMAIQSNNFDQRRRPEVAFFGGTFTGLPLDRIRELLDAVVPYMKRGLFRSIRVSTRPDALDEPRLKLIKDYGVDTVELGVQSMNNEVLSLSQRGHTAEDTIKAVQVLKKKGFRVGIQLMPGLPGDSESKFRSTIRQVIELHPDMVRLYPVIVIQGTALAHLYKEGQYQPLELEEAISICADSCIRIEERGIPVIRIGLMSSPSLLKKGQILAGPWHTAFGFLVRSRMYQKGIEADLPRPGKISHFKILAPGRDIPLLRGYKNEGLKWIEKKTGGAVVRIEPDDSLPLGRIRIKQT